MRSPSGSAELANRNSCFHQAEWREEVKRHFEKIKSEGTCLHRLDEELINRRREELRSEIFVCCKKPADGLM